MLLPCLLLSVRGYLLYLRLWVFLIGGHTALVTGITAKESVVSTLSVLTQSSSDAGLTQALQTIFTPLSAYAYLAFTVLYMPCIAAFAATKRELGSMKQALATAAFQTGSPILRPC